VSPYGVDLAGGNGGESTPAGLVEGLPQQPRMRGRSSAQWRKRMGLAPEDNAAREGVSGAGPAAARPAANLVRRVGSPSAATLRDRESSDSSAAAAGERSTVGAYTRPLLIST